MRCTGSRIRVMNIVVYLDMPVNVMIEGPWELLGFESTFSIFKHSSSCPGVKLVTLRTLRQSIEDLHCIMLGQEQDGCEPAFLTSSPELE